jgi:dihydrofolate synthase / folylpolyglutamate synthase
MDAKKYLDSLDINFYDFTLDRIKKVLAKMGNPQDKLRVIHVAGTNGKGSTSNFIKNILNKSGFYVGLYTSPHVNEINERIMINNKNISDEKLNYYINYVKQKMEQAKTRLTYFEFLTLAAIKYFYDSKTDYAVFECGLGGRLDATNVFKKPLVDVITNISLEHTDYLGNTLKNILNEKMGILRRNVPIVSGVSENKLQKLLKQKAKELNSPLYIKDQNFKVKEKGLKFDFYDMNKKILDLDVPFSSIYQINNASLAIQTVLLVEKKEKIKISEECIRQGLKEKLLNSRFESIYSKKYKINLIFDTAHNYHAFNALIKNLKFIDKKYNRKILVIGVLKDKNYKKILKIILPYFDFIYVTEPKSERKLDANILLEEINKYGSRDALQCVSTDTNYDVIMQDISKKFNKNDLIVISGSFYTVSGFKKIIGAESFGALFH